MTLPIFWMILLLGAFAIVFCGLLIWLSFVETKFLDGSNKNGDGE
jgi:hypothetical protein